jgi:hypothetical protein
VDEVRIITEKNVIDFFKTAGFEVMVSPVVFGVEIIHPNYPYKFHHTIMDIENHRPLCIKFYYREVNMFVWYWMKVKKWIKI